MVKHSFSLLRRILHSETIGCPQYLAAGLLIVYVAQCLWLIRVQTCEGLSNSSFAIRVYRGIQQLKGGAIAGTPESFGGDATGDALSTGWSSGIRIDAGYDQDRSPLSYLIAAAPLALSPRKWTPPLLARHVLARLPYLFFGVMLGGSLWYVARRLYGNSGGYIALVLYCFSPAVIANVAGSGAADMGAAWGAFGSVFTAIAVAHTLYAPREVVLWNWRRILLLGLSLALAIGNQFSFVIMAFVALLLMLWIAPVRRGAVVVIWGAACVCALLILFSSYFFHPALFVEGLMHARWVDMQPRAMIMLISYGYVGRSVFSGSPALMLALPAALATFLFWKRARYFGNSAPLLVAAVLMVLAINAPQVVATTFLVAALIFLFVFTAGVFADLLETRYGALVMSGLVGLLIASAFWNMVQLARFGI